MPLAFPPAIVFVSVSGNNKRLRIGTSVSNFHANKQALIKALNPSTKKINERAQRRTFRYTGGSVEKEIQAVYDGGLERGLPIGWSEQEITLRLLANDPFFYGVGEEAAALDTNDSATFSYLAGKIDELEGFSAPPMDGHWFNEFPVKVDVDVCHFLDACEEKGVLAGINVSNDIDTLENIFTVATTEMHTQKDYEKLLNVLKEAREVCL